MLSTRRLLFELAAHARYPRAASAFEPPNGSIASSPRALQLVGDRGHHLVKRAPRNITSPPHVSLKETVQREIPRRTGGPGELD